jgi:protein tyrosine/serine phosphatase
MPWTKKRAFSDRLGLALSKIEENSYKTKKREIQNKKRFVEKIYLILLNKYPIYIHTFLI